MFSNHYRTKDIYQNRTYNHILISKKPDVTQYVEHLNNIFVNMCCIFVFCCYIFSNVRVTAGSIIHINKWTEEMLLE